MLPIKPSPCARVFTVLTLTVSIILCLSPLILFAQEVDPATQLSQSPPVTGQAKKATNVIAVLKITVTDNDIGVSRDASTELPQELSVQGNYPNPFRTATSIVFDLPEQAQVYAVVFDLLGRSIHVSQELQVDAGWDRTLQLDLPHTSSGVYVYRINVETASGTHLRTGRIIRVR